MRAGRISKKRVLTRELKAIETLGAIATLCVDKTGTRGLEIGCECPNWGHEMKHGIYRTNTARMGIDHCRPAKSGVVRYLGRNSAGHASR